MVKPAVMAIAHRGASTVCPENTVAAFEEAQRLQAKAVEFDVRLSADGVPVVIHDETIDRTTNGHGRVADLTALELRRFDAGSWKARRFAGVRIPTLDEALWTVQSPVLELKEKIPARLLADALRRHHAPGAVVISFEPEWLTPLKRLLPDVTIGVLADTWTPELLPRALTAGAAVLVLGAACLSIEHVLQSEAAGLDVWCFTVNSPGGAAAAAAMGVKAIITDDPTIIRSRP